MRRFLGICLLLLLLSGCPNRPTMSTMSIPSGAKIHLIEIEKPFHYLIDPRTQSCFLLYSPTMAPIDCQKLRANVPEAAKIITWGDESHEVPDGG